MFSHSTPVMEDSANGERGRDKMMEEREHTNRIREWERSGIAYELKSETPNKEHLLIIVTTDSSSTRQPEGGDADAPWQSRRVRAPPLDIPESEGAAR